MKLALPHSLHARFRAPSERTRCTWFSKIRLTLDAVGMCRSPHAMFDWSNKVRLPRAQTLGKLLSISGNPRARLQTEAGASPAGRRALA